MERGMRWKPHVPCEGGEKSEIISGTYLFLFDLLFGEFETVFALFRKFPVFPVQGDGVHRLFDGGKLPVECRERIVHGTLC